MGGLLYKDFIAIRGKRLMITLAILTGIFVILRFLFSIFSLFNFSQFFND